MADRDDASRARASPLARLRERLHGRRDRRTATDSSAGRYRRLWRYSVLLTLFVSLTPLVIMTEVNHIMYRKALQTETRYAMSRTLNSTSRSLRFVIEKQLAALRLLSREKSPAQLSQDDQLRASLRNLRELFGGFVDLGLIEEDGVQTAYVGPYRLQGHNYADESWFHEVLQRGVHVSDVFMGHRQLPHFVVAVRQEDESGTYVLRASVDMDLLTSLVSVPELGRSDDVFVINDEGILQTPSLSHGAVLQTASVPVPPYSAHAEVVEDYDVGGAAQVLGYRYIDNSPFILMILKRRATDLAGWQRTREQLVMLLLAGAVSILLVVLWSSTYLVRQIREADRHRLEALHKMEFTSKMATIGRLAASVAHEINNPLAIINEKAGLLKDLTEVAGDHPHQERWDRALDSIVRSVERCSAVTHRLLGFTRSVGARIETLDLSKLLMEVMSFLGKEAAHRNITVETSFPEGFPMIRSDRGHLQQIFLNIVNNAVAAVRDGGRIHLTLETRGADRVAAIVGDDGPGIPPDKLDSVFEPFFSTKGEFGTGLGLSITYELVQKLGGSISVKSEVGVGTAFTVELPREHPGEE